MNILSEEYKAGFNAGHIHGYVAGYDAARKEIDAALMQMEHPKSCWNCPYRDRCLNAMTDKAELCGLQQEAAE